MSHFHGIERSSQHACFGGSVGFYQAPLHPHLLEAACRRAGHPLTLRRHEDYDHGYYCISTFMADHLRHHAAILCG